MTIWQNSDGLGVKFGRDEAASQDTTKNPSGEVKAFGGVRIAEFTLDLTDLTTSGQTILWDTATFPKNARIEEVEVEVVTGATSGGSATLDIGLVRYDRTTEIDFDGLVAAAAKATIDTAGKRLNLINGSTAAGALIGTTTANPGFAVAKAGTAVFTAGVLRVRVKWFGV